MATDSLRRDFVAPDHLEAALGPARSIDVPGPWQAQFEDLRLWWGTAWYERTFAVPPDWHHLRVRICFQAIDYFCNVWVNGVLTGSHEGGYLPFDFDITNLLRADGDNSVMVEVRDPGREQSTGSATPFAFDEIPHGKQSWYGPTGGLWLGVYLEASAPLFIRSTKLWADVSGRVLVDALLDSPASTDGRLSCEIIDPDGSVVSKMLTDLRENDSSAQVELEVSDPRLWDTGEPNLYRARLLLSGADGLGDVWSDHFGFRRISTEDGRILLNDRPIILRGALDQDYYPDTICTPPNEEFLHKQVLLAKEMGLNLLRCHIKVPDPRYLSVADKLGILVWAELPNWNELSPDAGARARQTFEGIVGRDFNHPSIIIWTIVNESWGVDLGSPDQRRWVAETYEWAKKVDPTRLIVDNSACQGNWHLKSDINDFHYYRALPDHQREWDEWTAAWASQPASTYSPHGDAVAFGDEPLVLSEFGNWGLPNIENLVSDTREEPWWFATGTEWGGGSVTPEGALERFSAWDLADVFGSWQGLAAASQEVQFESLKHEISNLRSHRELSGYVVTEFTDVNWECNGLLDLARNPKSFHRRLTEINAADVLVVEPERRRYWSGDAVLIDSVLSHFSPGDLDDCILGYGGAGIEPGATSIGSVREFTVWTLPPLTVHLPDVDEPEALEITLWLHSGGRDVATTKLTLVIWPAPTHTSTDTVRVVDSLDLATRSWLNDGGRAVIVATDEDALSRSSGLKVCARQGTVWEGDWAQGLHWLRPRLVDDAPLPPVLSSVWTDLVPQHVISGIEPEHAMDVLTGYFVGWLHYTVATTAGFRCGRGCGIVTTFPVVEAYGSDPLATWFLNRLTDIAGDVSFLPRVHI